MYPWPHQNHEISRFPWISWKSRDFRILLANHGNFGFLGFWGVQKWPPFWRPPKKGGKYIRRFLYSISKPAKRGSKKGSQNGQKPGIPLFQFWKKMAHSSVCLRPKKTGIFGWFCASTPRQNHLGFSGISGFSGFWNYPLFTHVCMISKWITFCPVLDPSPKKRPNLDPKMTILTGFSGFFIPKHRALTQFRNTSAKKNSVFLTHFLTVFDHFWTTFWTTFGPIKRALFTGFA